MRRVGWLERNTTRVIHHTLTHHDHVWLRVFLGTARRLVCQTHHARWLNAAAVNTNDAATTHRKQLILVEHFYFQTSLARNAHCMICKHRCSEMRRWHACKITRHVGGICDHLAALDASLELRSICSCANKSYRRQLRSPFVNSLQIGIAMHGERNTFDHYLRSQLAIYARNTRKRGCNRIER